MSGLRALALVALAAIAGGAGAASGADAHLSGSPVLLWRGPRLSYASNCSGCHLLSGEGIPGQVPQLKGFVGYFMRTPAGRAYVPRLPDIAYSPLSDNQLAALLNWVMRRFSAEQLPADFTPYRAAEIAALRARPLRDFTPVRVRALRGVLAADMKRTQRVGRLENDDAHTGQ